MSIAAFLLSGCGNVARHTEENSAVASDDWIDRYGGQTGTAYSSLDDIDTGNVGQLGLAWFLDLPEEKRALEATPVAVNGVLYFTGHFSKVYAVDATSGELIWSYDPKVWDQPGKHLQLQFAVNRGVAYANGKIYLGTFDGRLIALDAKTGGLIWSVDATAEEPRMASTGAPLIFDGKVLIGNSGGDIGLRAYVTAFDADTGKQLWRFYLVPGSPEENAGDPVMERAARTWTGRFWETGTGGGAWNGLTYDAELDQVYIGTGNGGPWNINVRSPAGGDNLFLASIVALDAKTGHYKWHYQVNPGESWDFKATANMVIDTIEINGKQRQILMQAPTNGFFYVLDRTTGKPISAEKIGKATWADHIDLETGRPVETSGIRFENGPVAFWPSPWGVHNWRTMSYDPGRHVAFIPVMQAGARYAQLQGSGYLDLKVGLSDPDEGKGGLLAWDPASQKPLWKVKHDTLLNGGTMATAGGLVFQGTARGKFNAYDASNGNILWSFDTGLGIVAAPVTYRAHRTQMVSVLVGYGGGVEAKFGNDLGWKYDAQPRRLLTFKLGAKTSLPKSPPPDLTLSPFADPDFRADPRRDHAGAGLYSDHCAVCHGGGLKASGGNAPDLRERSVVLNIDAFRGIVRDGVLCQLGMPAFTQLSDGQLRDIRQYIRAGAHNAWSKPLTQSSAALR